MNVELPYEIGTVLKTKNQEKIRFNKVHHYIIAGNMVYVVLEFCHSPDSRLSDPIPLEELQQKWEISN